MKKLLITTLVTCFAFVLSYSQTREKLELNESYSLAKIYTRSNQILKGRNLKLINDSTITYKNNKNYKEETMALSDLRSLKVKSGTKVVPYMLYGAGFMALSSLYAWSQVESDPNLEMKDNAGAIFAGFIGGGAVVGALVGMATPKWKSISIPRKSAEPTSLLFSPRIDFQNGVYALNLKVKF